MVASEEIPHQQNTPTFDPILSASLFDTTLYPLTRNQVSVGLCSIRVHFGGCVKHARIRWLQYLRTRLDTDASLFVAALAAAGENYTANERKLLAFV